jgi:hypothetical protein
VLYGVEFCDAGEPHQLGLDERLLREQSVEFLARLCTSDQKSASWRDGRPRNEKVAPFIALLQEGAVCHDHGRIALLERHEMLAFEDEVLQGWPPMTAVALFADVE